MVGLDVVIAPITPLRELPSDVTYRPIDLTPCANRSLADEKAEDGKGGWSDQGPNADLRTFPTGRRDFQGIPFEIGKGDKSIIVLDTRADKKDRLQEATIPIGYPVEGLYFLHGAGLRGRAGGLYQIQYADGTSADIPLVTARTSMTGPTRRRGGRFPHERGTRRMWPGREAVPCSPAASRSTGMLWVNPKPDANVKAVRFANPVDQAVPALIGLTAAVKKDVKGNGWRTIAKAQELLNQATGAIEANKMDEGKTLLKQAIEASPALDAAHQALADLCEKTGKEDETLEAYLQWTQAAAWIPPPWNRGARSSKNTKITRARWKRTTQSLKIEWNQPPIGEAKSGA